MKRSTAYSVSHNREDIFDIKMYWIKKTSKHTMSWLKQLTNNFEDSPALNSLNIGIDFVIPKKCDKIYILLSSKSYVRSLELHHKLTHTQIEIFSNWIKILDFENINKSIIHKNLWDSFDFEPINNLFYGLIIDKFNELVLHLENINFEHNTSILFTTRLFCRVLFIWFLNKMNLINPKCKYLEIDNSNQEKYYRNKLEVLIYEILNKDTIKRNSEDNITPYLNGGLFEPTANDLYKSKKLTFPNNFFNSFFDLLNKYNFTIDESSVELQYVAIDPEMLGNILEKLLSKQVSDVSGVEKTKDQGIFYTPREVVNFMCEESMFYFLISKGSKVRIESDFINDLVRSSKVDFKSKYNLDNIKYKSIKQNILYNLENLKVLDPAVGSGAFPMGMLSVLVNIYTKLDTKYESDISKLKRNIISKNLYGVDLEPIAIEICRLRVWLSIIVDTNNKTNITPLPNLEFKFISANSLIVFANNLGDDVEKQTLMSKILINYYKTSNKNIKLQLSNQYLKLANEMITTFKNSRNKELLNLNKIDLNIPNMFFDPFIMFGVDKFDIVIGNPPYLGYKGNKEKFELIKDCESILSTFIKGKVDYLYLFFHLSILLSKMNSIISFITTSYYLTADFGNILRKEILNNCNIVKFIDFKKLRLFKNAPGQHDLITILSKDIENNISTDISTCKRDGIFDKNIFTSLISKDFECFDHFIKNKKELYEDNDKKFNININKIIKIQKDILNKLNFFYRLSNICNVERGLQTGCDKHAKKGVFILNKNNEYDLGVINSLSEEEKSIFLKPLFKCSDIYKYNCEINTNKYVLYISKDKNINNYNNIYNHLNRFNSKLKNRGEVKENKYQWYHIQRSRKEEIFQQNKIVTSYRSDLNIFGYNNSNWYCCSDCTVITSKVERESSNILKILTAILNSQLILFYNLSTKKGKGDMSEWLPTTLNFIPININWDLSNEIIEIVNQFLENKIVDIENNNQLNSLIFKMYNINSKEIEFIEKFNSDYINNLS